MLRRVVGIVSVDLLVHRGLALLREIILAHFRSVEGGKSMVEGVVYVRGEKGRVCVESGGGSFTTRELFLGELVTNEEFPAHDFGRSGKFPPPCWSRRTTHWLEFLFRPVTSSPVEPPGKIPRPKKSLI